MSEFTSDDIARHSFRTSFRGFDPEEVRAFLVAVSEEIDKLLVERDRLRAGIGTAPDLKHEFETVGREVSAVLESARQAAESMRERAAAEAARWRSEALAETESELRRARADAEQLRSDAWSTSEELLTDCQRESERMIADAKKEALRLVGEAEREAHKLVAGGRREAEDTLRTARMEAERLLIEAQARHDGIIEAAGQRAEAAQERARALEQRRDELKRELDSVRTALVRVEGELDERREKLGLSAPEPVPTPVEAEERETKLGWEPGETVRVVRPGGEGMAETKDASVAQAGPQIRVISAAELAGRTGVPTESEAEVVPVEVSEAESVVTPSEEAPFEESAVSHEAPEEMTELEDLHVTAEIPAELEMAAEPEIEPRPETSPEGGVEPEPEVVEPPAERQVTPEPRPVAPAGDHRQMRFDELAGLFSRLREPEEHEVVAEMPVTETEVTSEPSETAEPVPTDEKAIATRPPPRSRRPEVDPFELRDRLLLPISNRSLRNLKRQIAEEQNGALEEIRLDADRWTPSVEGVRNRVRADLVVLAAESFAAGHAAAESYTGARMTRPPTPRTEVADGFASDLVSDLEHAVADGRSSGQGALQLGATVSRVFRAWRTDESERRIRDIGFASFHAGLVETLRIGGREDIAWVVSGRGCATCRALAEESVGDRLPPAHSGCGCAVVPG